MSLIEIQKKIAKAEFEYYKNLDKYLMTIKKNAVSALQDAKIYLFGSVTEGEYIPGKSDIDILIVSDKIPKTVSEQVKLKLKILKGIDFFAPFEIHLADKEIFEHYKRNVKHLVRI